MRNVLHRLMSLNIWFPVGAAFGEVQVNGLAGGSASLRAGFQIIQSHPTSSALSLLHACGKGCKCSASCSGHHVVPAVVDSTHVRSYAKINCFLKAFWPWWFIPATGKSVMQVSLWTRSLFPAEFLSLPLPKGSPSNGSRTAR